MYDPDGNWYDDNDPNDPYGRHQILQQQLNPGAGSHGQYQPQVNPIPQQPAQPPAAPPPSGDSGGSRDQALAQVQQAYSQGGYIQGVGQTIAPGSSITPAQRDQYLAQAQASGVDPGWLQNFMAQNGGANFTDYNRIQEQWANRNQHGGGGGSAQPSGGNGSQAGAGDAALSQFMQYLQQRQAAEDARRAEMQQILMGQLGQLQQPVDANSPGIREVLAGQRLGLQKGADRQRQDAAEARSYDGSGGIGGKAFATDTRAILENQANQDAMFTGNVLNREHSRKAQQLTQLLSLAVQLGDTSAAQNIQQQLNAINAQLGQSNFYDQMGFNYAGLNQQGNLQALMAILNAA